MKKVLLASTALVASAGFAAAEITVSGSAEMGIAGGDRYEASSYIDNNGNGVQDAGDEVNELADTPRFFQDFTIDVDGTGETDTGLTFGFHIEIEDSNTSFRTNGSSGIGDLVDFGSDGDYDATGDGGAAFDNESVFISGAYGTLTMGEIDGAYDKRMKEVALAGGTLADDETEHAGYNGNSGLDGDFDNQILRYDYEFEGFGVSLSLEQDDIKSCTVAAGATTCSADTDNDIWGVGFSYGMDFDGWDLGLGLAFQASDDVAEVMGVSAVVGFAGADVGINYSEANVDGTKSGDYKHLGIGAAYELDAWTFAANYGQYDYDEGFDKWGWGLLVNYDLGGGAVLQAGYGASENFDRTYNDDRESYSFGIALSF